MKAKYLVERKGEGEPDTAFRFVGGFIEANSMRDAMIKCRALFAETDVARIHLVSVTHTFLLSEVRW